MSLRRFVCLTTVVVVGALLLAGPADARVRHRHYRRVVARHYVAPPPPVAGYSAEQQTALAIGHLSGVLGSGIGGATSALPDPTLPSGYGYYGPSYHGPGNGYPGY